MSGAAWNRAPVLTLDGPGGAGKGTLASMLVRELNWTLLDSGALYRVVALTALRQAWQPQRETDRALTAKAARELDLMFEPDHGQGQRVWSSGEDVTALIRSDEVSGAASRWAAIPAIRDALLERQRAFAGPPGLIADGRDMGTVVFPDADLKLFVTASARERARRRHAQLFQAGVAASLYRIYREILKRDERDGARSVAPLKPAIDARVIDTTGQSAVASFAEIRVLVADQGWL